MGREKPGSKMHVLSDANGPSLLVGVSVDNTHDSEGLKPMVEGAPNETPPPLLPLLQAPAAVRGRILRPPGPVKMDTRQAHWSPDRPQGHGVQRMIGPSKVGDRAENAVTFGLQPTSPRFERNPNNCLALLAAAMCRYERLVQLTTQDTALVSHCLTDTDPIPTYPIGGQPSMQSCPRPSYAASASAFQNLPPIRPQATPPTASRNPPPSAGPCRHRSTGGSPQTHRPKNMTSPGSWSAGPQRPCRERGNAPQAFFASRGAGDDSASSMVKSDETMFDPPWRRRVCQWPLAGAARSCVRFRSDCASGGRGLGVGSGEGDRVAGSCSHRPSRQTI